MSEPVQVAHLNKPSHIRYALRHLRLLPTPYQSDDSNRITFGFFALSSLATLGALDRLDQSEREDYIDWIFQTWDHDIGGFGGAPRQELRPRDLDGPNYDQPHLAHTYTALLMLAILTAPSSDTHTMGDSPYHTLNLPKLLSFVSNCQRPNGSFGSFPSSPDEDVRFVYCAIAILTMVRVDPSTVINITSLLSFLKSCSRYEGGYGQSPYAEAQGGTTYCAIASLAMLNQLDRSLTVEEKSKTLRWLVDRQMELTKSILNDEESYSCSEDDYPQGSLSETVAGFQGRIGKPLDACYSFWCTAALTILTKNLSRESQKQVSNISDGQQNPATCSTTITTIGTCRESSSVLFNPEANIQFLLRCQSKQWGGIARSPEDHPDVYHTYLAIASLSISHAAAMEQNKYAKRLEGVLDLKGLNELTEHDPLLNVPLKVSNWIYQCFSSAS